MAINTQKLLPPSKLTAAERMAGSYDRRVDDVLNFQVKEKLIDVDKFLKKDNKKKQEKVKKDKVKKKTKARTKREKDLETPKGIKGVEKVKSLIPRTGLLDAVQRFATYTFLGYLLNKFGRETPKLLRILQKATPALNVVEKVIGGIFEGAVSFVDAGYKAHDQMRALSKDIGGEKAQKVYDEFSTNFNSFLNAVLTFGLSELGRGNEKPPEAKSGGGMVRGYARGGQTTRGGRVVGETVQRTFRAQKISRPQRVQPEKVNPGKDVGGKLKIEKLYPNPKPSAKKQPNPYKALTGVSESLDKGGWIGHLMSAGVKVAMGQKVNTGRIARSVSGGISSLSQAERGGLDAVSRSILGMSDGGLVPMMGQNNQVTENLLATLIQSRVNDALRSVTDELIKTGGGRDTGSGAAGAAAGGAGGFNTGASNYVDPKEVYAYLKQKGLSHNHILGILANIQAESSFDAAAIGDGGDSGGLFQHNTERFVGMTAFAGKDWAKNWKRQVDYALREDAGKQYTNKEFKTAADASAWFTLNFERPSNKEQKAKDRLDNLKNFGADGSVIGTGPSKIIKAGPIKGGAVITATGDPDAEQTGSDISIGKGRIGDAIQNPFDNLKITNTGFQGSGSGLSGSGYGRWVTGEVVIGGRKYEVLLGHLDEIKVKKGDTLSTGDVIGTQGISGRATGPHVTTHINALNGGDPSKVLKSVESVWTGGGFIETDNKPKPKSKVISSVNIGGRIYTERQGGKYYENGKPISKADFDAVRKNHPTAFKEALTQQTPRTTYNPAGGGSRGARGGRVRKMEGGGFVGSQRNYSSLSSYPSYDTSMGTTVMIQPMIIERQVPVPMGGSGQTIAFPVPVSVNNNMARLSR
jgi:hypothetical protein